MDKLTLLVSTFDTYSMCWNPFCHGLQKYWPNHPNNLVFITNYKEPEYGEAIKVGEDKGWSGNLIFALKKINTPYLLYAQEDYWINQPVNNKQILEYISILEDDKADYIRLCPVPPPDQDFLFDPRLGVISQQAEYRTSLQMALWRKEVLQELLQPQENAWKFEKNSGIRSQKYGDRFLCVTRRKFGINYIFTAIINGEWSPLAYEYSYQERIHINFDSLPKKKIYKYCKDHIKSYLFRCKKRILKLHN
jgi:hypothetical protein